MESLLAPGTYAIARGTSGYAPSMLLWFSNGIESCCIFRGVSKSLRVRNRDLAGICMGVFGSWMTDAVAISLGIGADVVEDTIAGNASSMSCKIPVTSYDAILRRRAAIPSGLVSISLTGCFVSRQWACSITIMPHEAESGELFAFCCKTFPQQGDRFVWVYIF